MSRFVAANKLLATDGLAGLVAVGLVGNLAVGMKGRAAASATGFLVVLAGALVVASGFFVNFSARLYGRL